MNVAARRFNLGRVKLRSGDTEGGRASLLAAARGFAAHTAHLFNSLSLAEQRRLLVQQAVSQVSGVLSVCGLHRCLTEGYAVILPWKGLLVDGLRRQAELAQAMDVQGTSEVSARWRTVRSQFAAWNTARGSVPLDVWKPRNDALSAEKEALERQLLLSSPTPPSSADLALADLQGALREGEVFVDIYRFSRFTRAEASGQEYAAVLVTRDAPPRFVPLGRAATVDAAVAAWRQRIGALSQSAWSALLSTVWQRVRNALPTGTSRVLVSPDGELIKLPWHRFGLRADRKAPQIVEVDSGRALVRARSRPLAQSAAARLLVVGAIDYDAGRTKTSPGRPGTPFPPLRWAAEESKTVAALGLARGLEPTLLDDHRATKQAVLEQMPRFDSILFATHAFANGQAEIGSRGREWIVGNSQPWGRNPLVESGIALTGANVRNPATLFTDGILTAEEILDSDLSDARLIVLSACSTGLGAETESQGIIGLRSAFMAAGARTLVMSLWNVDDEATKILMSTFFHALWEKNASPVAALQEGQEAVRRLKRFRASKYWAGWVVIDPQ